MRAATALVAVLLCGVPPAMATPSPPTHLTLENGLGVDVSVDPATPFADVFLTYRAGAGDDPIGRAGLAHLVEHLIFQGTRHLRSGDVHRLFMSAGALAVDGHTESDQTTYSVRLPAAALELAFWVFSSQMGFFLDQPDPAGTLDRERKVVLEELAGHMDAVDSGLRPLLAERLLYGAGHPYARVTLGNAAELARVTPADVRAFFIRHYRPDNATLQVRGPSSRTQVEALARKYFGPLPRRTPPPGPGVPPVAGGVRRATIEAPVAMPELLMIWSTPPGLDLQPLAEVLDSRIIRLSDHRQGVMAFHETRRLGGELLVQATVPLLTPERAEQLVQETVASLASEPASPAELEQARSMMEPLAAAQRMMGESPAGPLTPERLQALARALSERPRVVITTLPRPTAPRAGRALQSISLVDPERPQPAVPDPPAVADAPFRQRLPEARVEKAALRIRDLAPLPNGLAVRHVRGSFPNDIALDLLVHAPDGQWTLAERAAARVLVQLLIERLKEALSKLEVFVEPLEEAGALGVRLMGSRKHLGAVLAQLAEALWLKANKEGVERAARMTARELRRRLDDPKGVLWSLLQARERGQPLDSASQLQAIEAVRLEEVSTLYLRLFRPDNAALIATTDLPPARLRQEVGRAFSRWHGPGPTVAPARPVAKPVPAGLVLLDRTDSTRASVAVSFPFPHRLGPDQPAATVMAEALAGGLDSRLGRLRTRSGWLYGFSHVVAADSNASSLLILAEVSPARVGQLIDAIQREARDLAARALPDEELRALRTGRARAWATHLSWSWGARELASEAWRSSLSLAALTRQPARLAAVDEAAIRAAARTYLDPARAQVIVVAPRAQTPLSTPAEVYSWSRERGVWR
jgi:zinc protease